MGVSEPPSADIPPLKHLAFARPRVGAPGTAARGTARAKKHAHPGPAKSRFPGKREFSTTPAAARSREIPGNPVFCFARINVHSYGWFNAPRAKKRNCFRASGKHLNGQPGLNLHCYCRITSLTCTPTAALEPRAREKKKLFSRFREAPGLASLALTCTPTAGLQPYCRGAGLIS